MTAEEKAIELSNKYERIVEYSVKQCLIEMHEWDKEQFIKLVIEWLECVRLDYYCENFEEFIEDFKEYAEEKL